jgi:hypothetical protein
MAPLNPVLSKAEPHHFQTLEGGSPSTTTHHGTGRAVEVEPLNVTPGHPLSEKNVKSFSQFMEERASRSRQGSVQGAESHYSGVTVQTMASIQEELTQTKEIMADLAQSVKSLAEEMKQLKLSTRNADMRKSVKPE